MKTQTFGIDPDKHSPANLDPNNLRQYQIRQYQAILTGAHEKKEKENHWLTEYLQNAYSNYRINRENGEAQDNPTGKLKYDGKVKWEAHTDGYYHIKYTEGPTDKLWMEEKDLNYLTRLARCGILAQQEPTWRNVLTKWEPESKRIAAIARVESEIKAQQEVEEKRITDVAEPLVQQQDESFEQLLREQQTEQEAFQKTLMQQLQEQQALFKQFQNQQKQITQQLQEQQDQLKSQFKFFTQQLQDQQNQLKSQFEFFTQQLQDQQNQLKSKFELFTQQLQTNQPVLTKEFTEQQTQKQLESKTSELTTHFNNKTSEVTATIAQPKPV